MAPRSATKLIMPSNRPALAAGRARVCNAMPSCAASCSTASSSAGRPSRSPAGSIARRRRPPSAMKASTASSTPRSAGPTTAPGAITCRGPGTNAAGAAAEPLPPASSKTGFPSLCGPKLSSTVAPSGIGKATSCCSPLPVRPSSSGSSANRVSSCWQSNQAKPLNRLSASSRPGFGRSIAGCAKPSPWTMAPSSLSTSSSPTSSQSGPSSAIPTVPGKKAPSKTPSAACEDPCRARQTSTPSTTSSSAHTLPPTTTLPGNASVLSRQPKFFLLKCCTSNVNPHPRRARDDSVLFNFYSSLLSRSRGDGGDRRLADDHHQSCVQEIEADGDPEDDAREPGGHQDAEHRRCQERADIETGIDETEDLARGAGRRGVAHDHVARGIGDAAGRAGQGQQRQQQRGRDGLGSDRHGQRAGRQQSQCRDTVVAAHPVGEEAAHQHTARRADDEDDQAERRIVFADAEHAGPGWHSELLDTHGGG